MDDDPYRLPSPDRHLDDDPFEAQPLSPEQQRHVDLIRHIAQEVTARIGDNFVLKGGAALLLAYGSAALLHRLGLRRPAHQRRPDRISARWRRGRWNADA